MDIHGLSMVILIHGLSKGIHEEQREKLSSTSASDWNAKKHALEILTFPKERAFQS